MGEPGRKAQGKVLIKWSPQFAYAIGLIATDGCLSSNGRTVVFTSKDDEAIDNFLRALNIDARIGINVSGNGKLTKRVQIGDVLFFRFLQTIGLTPAKSKIISTVAIPDKFF